MNEKQLQFHNVDVGALVTSLNCSNEIHNLQAHGKTETYVVVRHYCDDVKKRFIVDRKIVFFLSLEF